MCGRILILFVMFVCVYLFFFFLFLFATVKVNKVVQKARYDLNCVKSAVNLQPTSQPAAV